MDAHVIAAALIGADEATKHRFLGKGWQSKSLPDLIELVARRAAQISGVVDAEEDLLAIQVDAERSPAAPTRKKPGPKPGPKPKADQKGGSDAES